MTFSLPTNADFSKALGAAPLPTAAAILQPLFARQDDPNYATTCGFFSFSDRSDNPYASFECGNAGCTTSGDFWGCTNSFMTTCYSSADPICSGTASRDPLGWCCTQSGFPNCVTAFKEIGNSEIITNYECWGGLNGEQTVVSTTEPITSTETSEGRTITVTQTAGIDTDTSVTRAPDTSEPTSSSATSSASGGGENGNNDGANQDDNNDGGSEVPIGAIVGGVLGGLALILLAVFGWWFMRHYKKKQAAQAAASPGQGPEPQVAQYGQDPYAYQPAPGSHGYYAPHQQAHQQGWGYPLPAEPKPPHVPIAEMPADRDTRAELQ
ncbi:hypothetical protein S40285_06669 [Stachybotrys chlorohalonatus IBT 40285]|uniref:Mid2 domain-containing protein n=1 Tax=Stachybotrys chlorohalonatus (strain IBT 40285) TaxID=1283841 RepID=A0A084QX93_STAC4|nr:hypothetical protein S40285_06669 [Stachybotrys chlorohalonata IBT 40285]